MVHEEPYYVTTKGKELTKEAFYKVHNGSKKFNVNCPPDSNLLNISLEGGGQLPKVLEGQYTSMTFVDMALRKYHELEDDSYTPTTATGRKTPVKSKLRETPLPTKEEHTKAS